MKPSLKGYPLPENAADARLLADNEQQMFGKCNICGILLSDPNAASTRNGWLETQISGTCEPCFDALFDEGEDE